MGGGYKTPGRISVRARPVPATLSFTGTWAVARGTWAEAVGRGDRRVSIDHGLAGWVGSAGTGDQHAAAPDGYLRR